MVLLLSRLPTELVVESRSLKAWLYSPDVMDRSRWAIRL